MSLQKPKILLAIPAYNEEETLEKVIKSIPEKNKYEIWVFNDCSTDNTAKTAINSGAKVWTSNKKIGLAKIYNVILEKAFIDNFDFLATIDADGQYLSEEIAIILENAQESGADLTIGDRQIRKLDFMKPGKKYGNILGSFFLKIILGLKGKIDASSGFRVMNKKAIKVLAKSKILSEKTYTHESLIIAKFNRLNINFTPITFLERKGSGESRLIKSVLKHILLCLYAILKQWLMFELGFREKA